MAKSYTEKVFDRIFLPTGEQSKLLKEITFGLAKNKKDPTQIAGVGRRTINDWQREVYSMPLEACRKLCTASDVAFPTFLEVRPRYWYTHLGAKKGGLASYEKYGAIGGDPEYRKLMWRKWWDQIGRYKHPFFFKRRSIHLPKESERLAEFVGIVLGDGGITSRQVTITLHASDDAEYIEYVQELCQQLFHLMPSVIPHGHGVTKNIIISRTALVEFFVDMGLVIGNKVRQQVSVPGWIRRNIRYSRACVRGLLDTDGCFYVDHHVYKDRAYHNAAVNFTNRSLPLLNFFRGQLQRDAFSPIQNTPFSISLRKEKEIYKYFALIGTSNMKHLKKFEQYCTMRYGGVPKRS